MIDRVRAKVSHAETHRQRTGRPFVTLTYAQSLDGSIAARRGERMSISGPETAVLTHELSAAAANPGRSPKPAGALVANDTVQERLVSGGW